VGNGKKTLQLIEELGLSSSLIFGKEEAAKRRFVLSEGQVKELPSSLFGIFSAMGMKIVPGVLKEPFASQKTKPGDESIDSFFRRRFGDTITEDLVAAMALGIWGGDIRYLSMTSCFPSLLELEKEHGSVLKGMLFPNRKRKLNDMQTESQFVKESAKRGGTFSFIGGLELLVKSLVKELKKHNVEMHRNCTVKSFQFTAGKFHIETDGQNLEVDEIISTLPAFTLAKLLPPDSPTAPILREIPSVSIAAVNLGYHDDVLPKDVRGFGYLVPPKEEDKILGVTFDSTVFPQHNSNEGDEQNIDKQQTRLTVMMGGDMSNGPQVVDVANTSQKEIISIAEDALERHLGIKVKPDFVDAVVCRNAIPQYRVGHQKKVEQIEKSLHQELGENFHITGTSFSGAGINDSIVNAIRIVDGLEDPKLEPQSKNSL